MISVWRCVCQVECGNWAERSWSSIAAFLWELYFKLTEILYAFSLVYRKLLLKTCSHPVHLSAGETEACHRSCFPWVGRRTSFSVATRLEFSYFSEWSRKSALTTQNASYIALGDAHTHRLLFSYFPPLLLLQCRWPSLDCFWQEIEQPFLFGTELLRVEKTNNKKKCLCLRFYYEFDLRNNLSPEKWEWGSGLHCKLHCSSWVSLLTTGPHPLAFLLAPLALSLLDQEVGLDLVCFSDSWWDLPVVFLSSGGVVGLFSFTGSLTLGPLLTPSTPCCL